MSKTITLCLTAALLFSFPLVSDAGLVAVSDVTVTHDGGVVSATAAHGVFSGNDVGSGDPLLTLLNDGGDATAEFTTGDWNAGDTITIGSGGLFNPDLVDGSPFDGRPWTYVGKSDDAGAGPFTSDPGTATGMLTLDGPVSGDVVISLKAGDAYAVYAFENVSNATKFTFNTQALEHDLSHATMYVPEPTSLITFATVVGLCGLRRRRGK